MYKVGRIDFVWILYNCNIKRDLYTKLTNSLNKNSGIFKLETNSDRT